MNDPMTLDTPLKTDADYEAAIDRYLVAIEQTLRGIEKTQDETERLRLENQTTLKGITERMEKMRTRVYD